MKKLSIKLQLFLFLSLFLIFLSLQESNFFLLINAVVAVIACVISDSLYHFAKTKKFVITESSLITGLIIGFVLSDLANWWFFVLSGLLAIISKHLACFRGKPIFNPAALGIFLVVAVFKQATYWHGAYSWYIIIPFGLYFTWRIKKIPIVCAYFLTYILLFVAEAHYLNYSLFDKLHYANYFLIFVMLIEPKTSPFDFKGQVAFSIIISIASFILYRMRFPFDSDLPALLIGNLLFRIRNRK